MTRITTNPGRDLDKPLVEPGTTKGSQLAARLLRGYLGFAAAVALAAGLLILVLALTLR